MWRSIRLSETELQLSTVLKCGQAFRWKASTSSPDHWSCVINRILFTLRQDCKKVTPCPHCLASHVYFRSFPDHEESREVIEGYLSLDINLSRLYEEWSSRDKHFRGVAFKMKGVRMLRQDPWECLVGFICSSNNNIPRITQMVGQSDLLLM